MNEAKNHIPHSKLSIFFAFLTLFIPGVILFIILTILYNNKYPDPINLDILLIIKNIISILGLISGLIAIKLKKYGSGFIGSFINFFLLIIL